jgi:hypothetical protein
MVDYLMKLGRNVIFMQQVDPLIALRGRKLMVFQSVQVNVELDVSP